MNTSIRTLIVALSAVTGGVVALSGCVEPSVEYRESAASPVPVGEETVTVNEAPPPLPVYEQPECPEPGYLWTPGYWAWNNDAYFWVPGTWVEPPRPEVLWTPGYWAANGAVFVFHPGYWGPHVGFYGGVSYGHGYEGSGYEGGRWDHGQFSYNRTVNNVNVTNIHNTYNTTVINHITINNISYNGGSGGTRAQPTEQERAAQTEPHLQPTSQQVQHVRSASTNHALFANQNQGNPPILATVRPGAFDQHAPIVPPVTGERPSDPVKSNPQVEPTTTSHPESERGPRPAPAEATPAAKPEQPKAPEGAPQQAPARGLPPRPRIRRGQVSPHIPAAPGFSIRRSPQRGRVARRG